MVGMTLAALLMVAADPQAAAPSAPPPPRAKMRCKRQTETGSLARIRKICHTEAEWEALRRDAVDTTGRMQDPSSGSAAPGG